MFWSIWKEQDADFLNRKMAQLIQDRTPTVQDKDIVSLFTPVRLLELTKYFVLFDYNVKNDLPISAIFCGKGNSAHSQTA